MNREEFMKELEYLLSDIPDEDKAEAIGYYRDYLEEAGDENEEAAIKEFGSPERIAAIIRSDLSGHLEDGGEFTEKGYQDERFRDPNYQVAKRYDLPADLPIWHDRRAVFHISTFSKLRWTILWNFSALRFPHSLRWSRRSAAWSVSGASSTSWKATAAITLRPKPGRKAVQG